MRILHISDIHFREPLCLQDYDPDKLYRDELHVHVRNLVERTGPVNAIAISGDVAFKGHSDEYQAATDWLLTLAKSAQCESTEIYVVPGNHDVNRGAYSLSRQVMLTAKGIADAPDEQGKETALIGTLQDGESAQKLLVPLEAYNTFASQFDCAILPGRPFWEKIFPIEGGVTCKLRGMTSIFLSGMNGDDKKGDLFLGAIQTGLSPSPGVINVAMAHHPVDWMFDADSITARLLGRPNVFLCGHKHSALTTAASSGALVLQAGSVNPERFAAGWHPAFNLMEFSVDRAGPEHRVRVRTWQYEYQSNPAMFRPVMHRKDGQENEYFDHHIPYLDSTPTGAPTLRPDRSDSAQTSSVPGAKLNISDTLPEEVMSMPRLRQLNKRFWDLPFSKRRAVMIQMTELDPGTAVERETVIFREAILRIAQRGALNDFEAAIRTAEGTL